MLAPTNSFTGLKVFIFLEAHKIIASPQSVGLPRPSRTPTYFQTKLPSWTRRKNSQSMAFSTTQKPFLPCILQLEKKTRVLVTTQAMMLVVTIQAPRLLGRAIHNWLLLPKGCRKRREWSKTQPPPCRRQLHPRDLTPSGKEQKSNRNEDCRTLIQPSQALLLHLLQEHCDYTDL